jgi:hypothetical protein
MHLQQQNWSKECQGDKEAGTDRIGMNDSSVVDRDCIITLLGGLLGFSGMLALLGI